jgi:hypothetical protein
MANGGGDNCRVDIVADYRARLMRDQGMSFREIAQRHGISLSRVRRSLGDAAPSRMRRELRAEIRKAGGLSAWWRDT